MLLVIFAVELCYHWLILHAVGDLCSRTMLSLTHIACCWWSLQ